MRFLDDADNWNQITPSGLAPKHEQDEQQCTHTGKREREGITEQWCHITRVRTKMFTQNQECFLPVRGQVLHGPRAGPSRGRKPILCDSHVTPVPHPSLHLITVVDTHAQPEDLNKYEQGCQVDMLHYSMGLRSLSLCPENKWEKRICSACPDMDCIHLPDWDWHWLSRVEVIWHQKGSEKPKAARSYEAHLLSYQCLKKSAQKWITIPSRHPSPCVTCSGWQTTLLQLVIGSQKASCVFPHYLLIIIRRTVVSHSSYSFLTVNNRAAVPFRQRSPLWIHQFCPFG